ncbi:MAG: NAD(P)H-dependent glycerol-3-phosphate dehydrogenase [Alphaproteobacteria bacterium]
METIGVMGGGAWGTALALAAARAGRRVVLWARDENTVAAINERHENTSRLPGTVLPAAIRATPDMAAMADVDALLLVVPAQTVRAVAAAVADQLAVGLPVVVCAKGLERASGHRLTQVVAEAAPRTRVAVLSGPSFAVDVAQGLPTAVTIAAADAGLAEELCRAMAGPAFRPYAETDMTGVEIGGAVKNVLAIAAGIVAGRGLGASAQAALIARGFAELRRLGAATGALGDTLMGLSGLGDLVLTCTSGQSRNFAHGERLGRGERGQKDVLVEGVATARAALDLADQAGVETPIIAAVAAIVDNRLSIDAAIESLLARPLRRERD